jgi:hypothetical protein
MMKAIWLLLSLVLLATGAEAQSAKEKYELIERCAKQAAETFRKEWERPSSPLASYENHYNFRLNKCFYIEITNTYEPEQGPSRSMDLRDLYGNRKIARYDKFERRRVLFGARQGMQKRRGMASFD